MILRQDAQSGAGRSSGTAEALAGPHHPRNFRDPARPDPGRGAQLPAQRPPGSLSHEPAGLARAAPAAPRLLRAASPPEPGKRPPRPEHRGSVRGAASAPRPLPARHTPRSRLPGLVHARRRGEAGASVTRLRTPSRGPGNAAQPGKAPAAAADPLPNSRSCACGAAVAEPPSFPSFKPPANGGAKPRESAWSRLPRGPPGRRCHARASA